MVRLQPPPPTPVHPRATGYKSRSQKGAKLDHFYKEEEYLRWTKPRLFQLSEKENQSSFLNNSNNGRLNAGRLRNRNGQRYNSSNGGTTIDSRRFNVFARKKIAPWGDIYSLGCTQEQINADFELIQGTRLGRHRIDGRYLATGCFVCSRERENSNREGDVATAVGKGSKNRRNDAFTSGPTAASILKMLKIASRGQLFHQHPTTLYSKTSLSSFEAEISFCAPWLQPTERWFSLGMYLASRYQVALWDSYQKYNCNQQQQKHTVHPGRIGTKGSASNDFGEAVLKDALLRAIRLSLKEIIQEEQESQHLDFLRDVTLWSILNGNPTLRGQILSQIATPTQIPDPNTKGYWKLAAQEWSQTPLVEIHSLFNRRFKCLVHEKLEEELAAHIERTIFEEDELEIQNLRKPHVIDTRSNQTNRARTNKKKKKRRKKAPKTRMLSAIKSNTITPTVPFGRDINGDRVDRMSDSSSSGDDQKTTIIVSKSVIDFPKNLTTARERNRNIIFVLGILEELTENAFAKVGLQVTSEPEEPKREHTIVGGDINSQLHTTYIQPPEEVIDLKRKTCIDGTESELPTGNQMSENCLSRVVFERQRSRGMDQDFLTHSDGNAFSLYSRQTDSFSSDIYSLPFTRDSDYVLGFGGAETNNLPFVNHYQSTERSILSSFFLSQSEQVNGKDFDDEERLMAASTAASIASSSYKDTTYVAEREEDIPIDVIEEQIPVPKEMSAIREIDDGSSKSSTAMKEIDHVIEVGRNRSRASSISSSENSDLDVRNLKIEEEEFNKKTTQEMARSDHANDSSDVISDCRSQTLQAPVTPPPTLSPIFVTLGDLKKMKYSSSSLKRFPSLDFETMKPGSGPGSLPPASPDAKDKLVSSWSREDLRIESFRDDHNIKNSWRDRIQTHQESEAPTYKSIAFKKTLAQPIPRSGGDTESLDHGMHLSASSRRKQDHHKEYCAQSETAMDIHHGEHHDWYREEGENQSLVRDETTTIISGISHRGEAEELADVQEERNYFRDMYLTLGAEVAKLKVMLATQQTVAATPVDFQDSSLAYPKMYGHSSFDPHGIQHSFRGTIKGALPGPMSDAGFGFHRSGDYESIISEDDIHDSVSKPRDVRLDPAQRIASSQTVAESDASMDFTSIKVPLSGGLLVPGTMHSHFNGFQSRVTKDILQFVHVTNLKMRKLDGRRKLAVERFSRLVNTIWPRAQVKLYGSYISGLCLPSSDLDFVVCLPAVHKKDLALAPGVLEGRNAINETSQKLLARELKGESWIDPRSIKVIERTAIPVIKVSTKDTRARMIKLDISFDGPEHHGLEANRMVSQTLEELPLLRPLMLVLKQLLSHRGLLTAYTGGLSSYCLFLMLARYLQEQPLSNSDYGSLLMGFLDFYGNHFDPRAMGISVGGRQYFARAKSHTAAAGYEPTSQPFWKGNRPPHQQHVVINNLPQILHTSSSGNISTSTTTATNHKAADFRRRNSFSDAGSVDDSHRMNRVYHCPSPPSGQVTSGSKSSHRFVSRNSKANCHRNGNGSSETTTNQTNGHSHTHAHNFSGFERPSTFDPLFVEDPLSATNNVGRNAFRINQVQRAFSDAHRALVASLDWDLQSADPSDKYPLLKCLLGNQREDVFFGL
ncbi:unnamed protein product [Pseudo-nitzschia multistriata]|uniref:Polymerase nucleotidyl transferase domain-containing protein n=1 Tax=Pseudo-nitzschia multistriata TaxID=183589 RepID=A0A448Z158_9STRA|nr:unnamed protein product [Pseudo-nitzschia multistriata]